MFTALSLRLIGVCSIALAAIEFALVLERFCAAIFKSYKFSFDGVSPIILSRETVFSFFVVAVLFLFACIYGASISTERAPFSAKLFRMSIVLNAIAVIIVTLLLVSPLARLST